MVKPRSSVFLFLAAAAAAACSGSPEKNAGTRPLRILMDSTPATLNPRSALDAAGQRINALMFRALTRLDSDLQPQPDLAEGWKFFDGGRTWTFRIRDGLLDQEGLAITAELIARCLENYRAGKPVSPYRESFPSWKRTLADGPSHSVTLQLEKPDPYLVRNLSLLRYFRVRGDSADPCREPDPARDIIGSGNYRPTKWDSAPEGEFSLAAMAPDRKAIQLVFVHDENTKALKILRGDIDVAQNSLGLSKTRWVQKDLSGRFQVIERDGVSVAYLAFNLKDPVLAKKAVREAIALGIDRDQIVRKKFLGFAKPAGSFLSPILPESTQVAVAFDPEQAGRKLDGAGFPRGADGTRLRLHYKTTPVRETMETAQIFQRQLRKIGIDLVIDVVEPAVFFASIRKGAFQMYSSRWLGVADGSILYRTLRSGQLSNRVGYSNPRVDGLLDQAVREIRDERRIPLMKEIQKEMAADLPYFPLWYWNNAVIFNKNLKGLEPGELSLSGGLEPLTHLR